MVLILGFVAVPAGAQEAVIPAGHDASGPGGSAAFTVGQVAWEFQSGAAGSSAQGVQHAAVVPVTTVSGIEMPLRLSVYPNPAMRRVVVMLGGEAAAGWSYRLFDASGRLWRFGQGEGSTGEIDLEMLPPAAYFLRITSGGKGSGTTIIIKENRP